MSCVHYNLSTKPLIDMTWMFFVVLLKTGTFISISSVNTINFSIKYGQFLKIFRSIKNRPSHDPNHNSGTNTHSISQRYAFLKRSVVANLFSDFMKRSKERDFFSTKTLLLSMNREIELRVFNFWTSWFCFAYATIIEKPSFFTS